MLVESESAQKEEVLVKPKTERSSSQQLLEACLETAKHVLQSLFADLVQKWLQRGDLNGF